MQDKHIFVMGMTDFHCAELHTLPGVGDWLHVHGLLHADEVAHHEEIDPVDLLRRARRVLDDFDGPIDGIIAQWDFPTTLLVPMLCEERGLASPSVESVIACGHKVWSRRLQHQTAPACVPRFCSFDPHNDESVDAIDLDTPYWVKPAKGFASQMNFRIDSEADLTTAVDELRAHAGRLGQPYHDMISARDVPADILELGPSACLAEELMTGVEVAHEGHVREGEVHIHCTLDMVRSHDSFTRFEMPSRLPAEVLDRMERAAKRMLGAIGFDNGCFNAEFFWDEETDTLRLVEINPRLSQSHNDLVAKTCGRSNHQVAVDIALGRPSTLPPMGSGPFAVAAKFLVRTPDSGQVTALFDDDELEGIERVAPETVVQPEVRVGQDLANLVDQDAYTYKLASIYLGAPSRRALLERYGAVLERLTFEVDDKRPELLR